MNALDRWCETHGALASARWEMEEVIRVCRPEPGGVVLEIGSHQGASLAVWIEEFEPALAIGVEAELSERTEALHKLPATIIYGDSTAYDTVMFVREKLEGRKIDFLYIDGDHSYQAVLADFMNYRDLVATGGYIVFDDAYTEFGVRKLTALLEGHGHLVYGHGDSGGKYIVRQDRTLR